MDFTKDFEYHECNDEELSVTGICSTPVKDADKDIVIPEGIDTSIHKLNPVVMLNHGVEHQISIGKCESPNGEYKVWLDEDGNLCHKVYFDKGEVGREIYRLFKEKMMRGWSIGFKGLDVEKLPPNEGRYLIKRSLLREISATPLPSNPLSLTFLKSLIGKINTNMDETKAVMPVVNETNQSSGGSIIQDEKIPFGQKCMRAFHKSLCALHDQMDEELPMHDNKSVKSHFSKCLSNMKKMCNKSAELSHQEYSEELKTYKDDMDEDNEEKSLLQKLQEKVDKLEIKKSNEVLQEKMHNRINKLIEKFNEAIS
jgi:HK97 family phage prohead protease